MKSIVRRRNRRETIARAVAVVVALILHGSISAEAHLRLLRESQQSLIETFVSSVDFTDMKFSILIYEVSFGVLRTQHRLIEN